MPAGTRTFKSGDVILEVDVRPGDSGAFPSWAEWYYTALSLRGWFRKQYVALDFETKNTGSYDMGVISGSINAVSPAADA